MTSGSTVPMPSASAMRSAIRSRARRCSCCAKASSTRRASTSWRKKSKPSCRSRWTARWKPCRPRPRAITKFVYSPDLDPDVCRPSTRSPWCRKLRPTARSRRRKTMADLITATLRDEMKRDERIVIFGEDVADCSREEYLKQQAGQRQGRSLQAHLRPAMRIRQRPRVQFSAGRGRHRRPRHRHGHARAEAGRRNSVLRLHLAGDDADSRRAQRRSAGARTTDSPARS